MGPRDLARRLPLAGAAVASAAVGHSIAYLIVAPQGRTRAALLTGTGHGYRSTLAAAEIVLGMLAVLAFLGRRFRHGQRSSRRPAAAVPWLWLAARLALLQVAIFSLQEIVERASVGYPLSDLSSDRLLGIGALVQVMVALLAAALLVWLGRAAEAVGRAFGLERLPRAVRVVVVPPRVATPRAPGLAGARGIRGPPRVGIA